MDYPFDPDDPVVKIIRMVERLPDHAALVARAKDRYYDLQCKLETYEILADGVREEIETELR